MRKSLFALLAILLAFPAVYAQDAASRQTKYNQLLKQRQELMSWSEENPIAPRFIGMMKEREARDIRTHLYTHFFDLRKKSWDWMLDRSMFSSFAISDLSKV